MHKQDRISLSKRSERHTTRWLAAAIFMALTGCVAETDMSDISSTGDIPTFEEFVAEVYQEPWEDGVFIVNGDRPISDIKQLEEFYHEVYGTGGALVVNRRGNGDARWDAATRQKLTYCISDDFGRYKSEMVAAMGAATAAWEQASNVDFVHVSAKDSRCSARTSGVLFDVRLVDKQPYLARAFFPGERRRARNVLVDSSSFGAIGPITLTGVLRHELGHVLGFRHEHTRPEAGTCFEDDNWRELTDYDRRSVMHYPQCNGVRGHDLDLTSLDIAGVRAIYGAPGSTPKSRPVVGSHRRSAEDRGIAAPGRPVEYEPLRVVSGSILEVELSGSGDADLYVRFDQAPTRDRFDCRPYRSDSYETCRLDVPRFASRAFVMIDGYEESEYTLAVSWVEP